MTAAARVGHLRYAARSLRRSPGFVALAVVTLGLAIGVAAGIWSVVDVVLLDPLPFPDSDRLVILAGTAPGSDLPDEFPLSAEFFLEYRERADLLADLAVWNSFTSTLRTDDRVERIRMSMPTGSLFSTLQAEPILGRLPRPEDEDRVAVLSHSLWLTWFGADPAVLGRTYSIAGESRTVIGVMGPDFWFPSEDTLLWIPVVPRAEDVEPGRFGFPLIARVKPGVTNEALVAQLQTVARGLPERWGGSPGYAELIGQFRPLVQPLEQQLLGTVARPLWVLLGAVGIVLLIACANVANLFLVRCERRQRDLATRRALGATRGDLIRSLLAEAIVVAALAGALALVLAWATVPLFLAAAPPNVPRLGDVTVTARTVLFTLAASALAALLCGLVPAVRSATVDLGRLRDGGRGSTRRRHWAASGLVVAQTALALVLLIGSGLLVRSYRELSSVDPGYDTEDLFTFQIAPEQAQLVDGPAFARFHLDFMERLRALPGVETVGIVENMPLNESVQPARFRTEDMGSEADSGALVGITWTAGDYFRAMGIELVAGRSFDPRDPSRDVGNVVVSRSAARLLWSDQDPIGRRLRDQDDDTWHTVVGVVEDVMQDDFRTRAAPLAYFPLIGPTADAWVITTPAYVLKTARAEEIAPEVRALVREVAPEAPMYRVFTLAGLAADSMVGLSFTMLTLGIASALALVLGAVGLFGVLSFAVAERTQEIGVRMALGAQVAQVRRMVLSQGARVATLGVVVGAAAAMAATRALGSLLFGVGALDGWTFGAMSLAMVAIALVASWLPARRASSVDPIVALRTE
jgi:predicted permease